jgi:ABC-type phosphate transport system substrate-binding protein
MGKTETATEIVYVGDGFTITVKKDSEFLDVHQRTNLNSIFSNGGSPQTWQELANYLDTKI